MAAKHPPSNPHEKTVADRPITRREFVHVVQGVGVGAILLHHLGQVPPTHQDKARQLRGKVVHVRDDNATFWDFSTGWYGYYVDQGVVDAMVEEGLRQLTGMPTGAEAWKVLIPNFAPGQKMAIKVNFNNFVQGGADPDSDINALIEPVNALLGTLIQFGFEGRDITVYDVTHAGHNGGMPLNSFISRCLYPDVNFEWYIGNPNPFSATEKINFRCPPPPAYQIPDAAVASALANSDYLINMPLTKAHSLANVTLGFKNHFGSIDRCDLCHTYLPTGSGYQADYSPLVAIYLNRHFRKKTVLTVGDCLFGNWWNLYGKPRRWLTFDDDAPNSLFLSADPVAADAVQADFIDIERQQQGYGALSNKARRYLKLADDAGLGLFDTADPWLQPAGIGYGKIVYKHIHGV